MGIMIFIKIPFKIIINEISYKIREIKVKAILKSQ
jgi:hypothetical protein